MSEIIIERGDIVYVDELKVEVMDIITRWGETFIVTEYGEFNINLITKINKT